MHHVLCCTVCFAEIAGTAVSETKNESAKKMPKHQLGLTFTLSHHEEKAQCLSGAHVLSRECPRENFRRFVEMMSAQLLPPASTRTAHTPVCVHGSAAKHSG